MKDNLFKKFNEKSVEYEILDFLEKISHLNVLCAFTGGVAFGAYLGHFPRRLKDIDMVTDNKSFSIIKSFLESKGFYETTKSKVIREFCNDELFFEVDIHIEYLYLALPPEWQILEKFSLIEALHQRIRLSVQSLDGLRQQKIYVIPPEYHFLIKLFPPIEPSNLHDLLYLTLMWKQPEDLIKKIKFLIRKYNLFRDFFITRIEQYINILPHTIWFAKMNAQSQKRVCDLWKELVQF